MDKFWTFVKTKPSLALVLLSLILTGFSVTPAFASLLMHLINVGLLLSFWWFAKKPDLTPPAVLMLMSIGLTAVMVHPNEWGFILEIVNFFVLVGSWGLSSKEDAAPAPAKS